MSANDDFPRGWLLSTGLVSAGSIPGITIPAMPGISHVLTFVEATLYQGTGNTTAFAPLVETGTGVVFGILASGAAGAVGRDVMSMQGNLFMSPVGVGLVVTFSAPALPTTYAGLLVIGGHDI